MAKLRAQTEVRATHNDDAPEVLKGYLIRMDPEYNLLLPEEPGDVKRRRIWEEANPNLRGAIVRVAEWFSTTCRRDILERYHLGELVKAVQDDLRNRERHYGSRAIEKLMQFFDVDRGTLYNAFRLTEVYTRDEIEGMSHMRLRDGRPVCYSHVRVLMVVDDRALRDQLLARTLEECWTADELVELVVELNQKKQKVRDGLGRPLAFPKNLDAVIHQQSRAADDFLSRSLKVWERPEHSLLAKAQDPFEEFNEERVTQLKAHAEKLRSLADEAGKRADEAEQAYEYVLQVMVSRKKQVARLPAPVETVA